MLAFALIVPIAFTVVRVTEKNPPRAGLTTTRRRGTEGILMRSGLATSMPWTAARTNGRRGAEGARS
jgi:hypothetical protein